MNYEALYKEALEKIRKGIQPLQDGRKISGVTKGFLEEVFPELREPEDERIRGAIIDHLKDNNLIEWAAWLEKQGEQKSAEWSEDDEEKFRDVIRLVEQGAPVQSMRDHYTNWLKSIKERITWKPSDEQMKVLLSEVEGWTEGCPKQKVLESLYNDLKKLK